MAEDPLRPIAERLFPLVQGNLDRWRTVVRRWASNPPTYDSDPPEHELDPGLGQSDWAVERVVAAALHGPLPKDEQWAERRLNEVGRVTIKHDGEILPVPFPEAALAADEQIVLLAAIHDGYADGLAKIDPWTEIRKRTLGASSPDDLEQLRLALRYQIVVQDRLPNLRKRWKSHRAKVKIFLVDAERNLAIENANRDQVSGEPRVAQQGERRTPGNQPAPSSEQLRVSNLVTRLMMASIVQKSKKSIDRLCNKKTLPQPSVKGKKGQADEWEWRVVKPVLEKYFNKSLPDQFPSASFVRQ
jgi:hypothetical protein